MTFLADIRLVDLVGLGSDAVMRIGARHARGYGARFALARLTLEEIGEFARAADLAILYDNWFPGGALPPGWVKVGEWEIAGNVACNAPVVSFFAPDGARAARLLDNLERFAGRLPPTVAQRYAAPPP